MEFAGIVIEPQQHRPHDVRRLVPTETGHHAVRRPFMLGLEHHPLVRLVGTVERFGENAVEPCSLKLHEPFLCPLEVGDRRRHVHGRLGIGERLFQRSTALGERPGSEVFVPEGQEVEPDGAARLPSDVPPEQTNI